MIFKKLFWWMIKILRSYNKTSHIKTVIKGLYFKDPKVIHSRKLNLKFMVSPQKEIECSIATVVYTKKIEIKK